MNATRPRIKPKAPSASNPPPKGSSIVRGSSRRNEGTVKVAVINAAMIRGSIRSPKSICVARRTDSRLAQTQTCRQPETTASDTMQ